MPHIESALKCGDNDPAIHALVGSTYYCFGQFDQARAHIEQAHQLNTNDVITIGLYGFYLAREGDAEEDWRWMVKARQMDSQYNPFASESEAEAEV